MKQIEQTITSLEVAEMVGKDHSKLLKDIRRYSEQLGEAKIGFTDFFTESEYITSQNKKAPCYKVTKKGCEFIAHKLTGQKGTEFTAKYINRFHDMEEVIKNPLNMSTPTLIQILAKGNVELDQKIEETRKDLEEFKQDLPLLGVECEKITHAVKKKATDCVGGYDSEAYRDKSLRSKVYSDIYGQIKREFGVDTFKAIKRSQCDKAINLVIEYKLPMALKDQISYANYQLSIKEWFDDCCINFKTLVYQKGIDQIRKLINNGQTLTNTIK